MLYSLASFSTISITPGSSSIFPCVSGSATRTSMPRRLAAAKILRLCASSAVGLTTPMLTNLGSRPFSFKRAWIAAASLSERLMVGIPLTLPSSSRFTVPDMLMHVAPMAIDKSAAIGATCMSISGTVNLEEDGKVKGMPTINLSDKDAAAIQARLKEKGLEPRFVNIGVVKPTADEAQSRKIFAAAKRLGIDVLVAEPETHGKMEELPGVMDIVEKLAKEYNIKVAIHNHPGPKNFYWNPDTVLAAVKGRSPLLGACADVGHYVRSGLDPVDCLKKLEGRIITLHFKDLNETGPKAHDVPWGT